MSISPRARAAVVVCAAVLVSSFAGVASSADARRAAPASSVPAHASSSRWHVTDLGRGRYDVAWTSPTRLPITSDRPTISGGGLDFGVSTVRADERTVHAVVTSPTAPDPASLDVLLSGDRLDVPGRDTTTQGAARGRADDAAAAVRATVPTKHLLDAPDPGTPGPYDVVSSDYTLPALKLPGMPEPIEMLGHVVEPALGAAPADRPLVLFLHGRHGVCYRPGHPNAYDDTWPCRAPFEEIPSYLGYVYIQQLLASQGYTTVSVSVNGINAQDYRLADGGADARAAIIEAHLDHWTTIAADHDVDLSQVVLVGHSRGGEGVDRASLQIPTTAPYTIAGQVLIAPVDFASNTAAYVPTVTLLPYCDGDVYDLQGQKFTDTARDLAPGDDTSLKSSVLVMGADHNFFNTEWTPGVAVAPANDDWFGSATAACGRKNPDRLKAPEQRSVGAAYVAGAVKLFTGDQAYLPMFDGSSVTVPSIGDADVRSSAIGGGRVTVRPGLDADPSLATGGAASKLCRGATTYDASAYAFCGRLIDVVTPNWAGYEPIPTRQFLEMSWTQPGAEAGLTLHDPLDLSTGRLELRTLVDPDQGDVQLRVRITDGAGNTAVLTPEDGETLPALLKARDVTKIWGQALVVDTAGNPDVGSVDLTDVTGVSLIGDSDHGRIWVQDLSAAPSTLAPVPSTRLPQIELGGLTVQEGDDGRIHTAQIPFHVNGTLTAPARFRVVTTGQERNAVHAMTIDVAPGQTDGTIPVAYYSNTLDDYDLETQVVAWPLRGLVSDDYLSSLRVLDDDPAPTVTVTRANPRLHEGQTAVLHITLSKSTGYESYAYGQIGRGGVKGKILRGDDVPLAWLKSHGDTRHLDKPLRAYVYASFRNGSRRVDLTVPIAKDHVKEPDESLTLKVQVDGKTFLRTFTILASK